MFRWAHCKRGLQFEPGCAADAMNYRRPELRDRLASEYVLGTLQGRARSRFQQLLREDPLLVDRVAFWERELTPLAEPVSGPAPSAKVWDAIAVRVAPNPGVQRARQDWFSRWFGLRGLGSLVAGVFLGLSVGLLDPSWLGRRDADTGENQLPESYVGVLATADGRTGMIVASRRFGQVMDVKQVIAVPAPAGTTLFLWAIAANGSTRPIGPVPQGRFVQVPLAATSEALFSSAAELALSFEATGSTPAAPSGAYVYRGLCGKLWQVKTP